MNIHRNHLFHSIAICLLSVMALFTSCDKTDNVPSGIDSPDENTQYLLQPPTISIEPFGGGSPATRAAVAIEEERQAFNIGDELGNIITLGNSEIEDTPQTRTLASGTYYRIVIYKLEEWEKTSPNILVQRLCKTGVTGYFKDLGDSTDPIYLNPGDYRIFCYSFNKTTTDKLSPLDNGITNVSLSDGDDFLSSDIITKKIDNSQLGVSVSLGPITLEHRCCCLTGTLSVEAFTSTGISAASPIPSLSVSSTFNTAGKWSIKGGFSGTSTNSDAKKIPISVNGNTYTGSLIVLPPASKSLSASYNFKPNGGNEIDVSNKSIATNTTFSSGGSYSFTIKAIGAYVLTETNPVQIGSYKWAYANLNNDKKMETKPWVSGRQGGSDNDYWRWNMLSVDTESGYPPDTPNTWSTSTDPCKVVMGNSWKVPPMKYFEDLVEHKLDSKRVLINDVIASTDVTGFVSSGSAVAGCVFYDSTQGTCIFLPAAGSRDGSTYNYVGTRGYYWSATLNDSGTGNAYLLYLRSGDCFVDHYARSIGRSLRCAQ